MKQKKENKRLEQNSYYGKFLDYIYKRVKDSPFKASREVVYYIAQEVWRELETRFLNDGIQDVFYNLSPTLRRSKKKLKLF